MPNTYGELRNSLPFQSISSSNIIVSTAVRSIFYRHIDNWSCPSCVKTSLTVFPSIPCLLQFGLFLLISVCSISSMRGLDYSHTLSQTFKYRCIILYRSNQQTDHTGPRPKQISNYTLSIFGLQDHTVLGQILEGFDRVPMHFYKLLQNDLIVCEYLFMYLLSCDNFVRPCELNCSFICSILTIWNFIETL